MGCQYELYPEFDKPILFIKGLKVKKRNISEFNKKIGKEMIWKILGFNDEKRLINNIQDHRQVIFDIIVKYIQMNHDIKLYTLNARFDPTHMCSAREFIETRDLKKLTYKKTTKGNRMVLDFEKKRAESNKTLEPGRFFYFVIEHPNSKAKIGHKICLVSESNKVVKR